jgi:hypothetical protein
MRPVTVLMYMRTDGGHYESNRRMRDGEHVPQKEGQEQEKDE